MFIGASVRDLDGTTGRILSWRLPEVGIGWEDKGKLLPREEKLDRANPRLQNQIEVHTLNAGWVSLGQFAPATGVPMLDKAINQLRSLLDEADHLTRSNDGQLLTEAPKKKAAKKKPAKKKGKGKPKKKATDPSQYPFKNYAHLGPGPRSGENDEEDYWKCNCKNYKCNCTGASGEKKKVNIGREYKREYNKEYKAWRRKQGW